MDSVQMLDSLNVGVDLEEWPLHRDVTLSPPLTSSPITLENDGEHLNLVKTNSVSMAVLKKEWKLIKSNIPFVSMNLH